MITFQLIKGKAITSFLDEIANLRISIFCEYPYLYDGNLQYEKEYLNKFTQIEEALVAIVRDDQQVIGIFTGLPMENEVDDLKQCIDSTHISKSFYLSEIILQSAYRGKGIGYKLFQTLETSIMAARRYQYIYFASVIRPENHPSKPVDYKSLDGMWTRNGYVKTAKRCSMNWKEICEPEETEKELALWVKEIA